MLSWIKMHFLSLSRLVNSAGVSTSLCFWDHLLCLFVVFKCCCWSLNDLVLFFALVCCVGDAVVGFAVVFSSVHVVDFVAASVLALGCCLCCACSFFGWFLSNLLA